MGITDEIRSRIPELIQRWERSVVAELPVLAALPRPVLCDHLPGLLDSLASWIDGVPGTSFAAVVEGHALLRHAAGIDLVTITTEYAILRRALLEELAGTAQGELLVRLDAGIDLAVAAAVERYTAARDHVRERFIGILAHDLRDPLTTVMVSATLLADMTLGDKQAQLVNRITRGAGLIEHMIDDVLDFARGRLEGGIPITPTLVDLAAVCTEAIDEARTTLADRSITFDARGDLRGSFDRDRLRQALANLLSNAHHYGHGDIRVRAWEREDRHAVFTAVTNHGCAITADRISNIFDPFTRELDGRSRHGLGLGLYIVEQIARAHGGLCRAECSNDEITFTIEWPRVPVEERG
ncbi:MAG: HAMP domain-containing sensor histidine kinase [Kofleriaceae bacterium]